MVRVLLDATAVPADRGGVGRYVDSLLPALVRTGVEVRVACQVRDREHYAGLSGTDPLPAPGAVRGTAARLVWEQLGLGALVERADADLLHSPHYTQPRRIRRPSVVTLHDATFFTDPQLHSAIKGPFFRRATRRALHRAGCCVVPSQATATELVRVAGADPSRLQVAHHGVDAAVFAPPSAAAVAAMRARLGLAANAPYVAFLGTLEPRKNVPALIRGWVAACERLDGPAPALVLAGGPGWDDEVPAAISAVPSSLQVVRAGYIAREDLAALLGGAAIVAYPSLGEGFGLPVLEAMACGAPVLTTRRLALPEVGGDAVAYTEPDAESIAAALSALLRDAGERTRLAAAGLQRAAGFTWDACAQAHLLAYRRALDASGVRR